MTALFPLQTNARFHASRDLTQLLQPVANAPELAVVLDVDALERSALARIDRVMLFALDALARAGVHIVLVANDTVDRAASFHHELSKSWCIERAGAISRLRGRMPAARVVAITNDYSLLSGLTSNDRKIVLDGASDVSVRAALWWLVGARTK